MGWLGMVDPLWWRSCFVYLKNDEKMVCRRLVWCWLCRVVRYWVLDCVCGVGFVGRMGSTLLLRTLMSLDFRETTFVFDYVDKTVELYTTSRTVFLKAIARNHNVIEAVDLKPGYRILYAMDQVREPEALLRKRPATASIMNKYLTEKELQRRKNQREIFNERMGITSNQ